MIDWLYFQIEQVPRAPGPSAPDLAGQPAQLLPLPQGCCILHSRHQCKFNVFNYFIILTCFQNMTQLKKYNTKKLFLQKCLSGVGFTKQRNKHTLPSHWSIFIDSRFFISIHPNIFFVVMLFCKSDDTWVRILIHLGLPYLRSWTLYSNSTEFRI